MSKSNKTDRKRLCDSPNSPVTLLMEIATVMVSRDALVLV